MSMKLDEWIALVLIFWFHFDVTAKWIHELMLQGKAAISLASRDLSIISWILEMYLVQLEKKGIFRHIYDHRSYLITSLSLNLYKYKLWNMYF